MTNACRTAVVVAGAVAPGVVYSAWVRPRLMRWGATDDEVTGPYPGAELIPDGTRAATMAVLGRLVQDVSGVPLPEMADQLTFRPLA